MYEWAGEFRTVNIGKDGHGFGPEHQLEEYSSEILGAVREANMFAGRDRAGVVEGLVSTMHAVNITHSGGQRAHAAVLTEHIAEHAGYLLDWHRISPDEQNFVMAQAFDGEFEPLDPPQAADGQCQRRLEPTFTPGVGDSGGSGVTVEAPNAFVEEGSGRHG